MTPLPVSTKQHLVDYREFGKGSGSLVGEPLFFCLTLNIPFPVNPHRCIRFLFLNCLTLSIGALPPP